MAWARRRYRGNKAWVEVGDDGALALDDRGLARLRYKPDDDRTYSVRPSEVVPLEGGQDDPAAGADPARRAAAGVEGPTPAGRSAPRGARVLEATEDADLPALAEREVQAWTDGASSGNPGPSGAGVVLLFGARRKEISRYLGETTNNVAELTAVAVALDAVRRRDLPVRVLSDSTYVIGVLSGALAARANADLVRAIRERMATFPDLAFVKVAGHAGVEWNERADALAREAIRTKASVERTAGPGPRSQASE